MVGHAARALGRPVKWTNDRSGSFLSDQMGRDHEMTAELALDKDGRFLAQRVTGYSNIGGYLATVAPTAATMNAVKNSSSVPLNPTFCMENPGTDAGPAGPTPRSRL